MHSPESMITQTQDWLERLVIGENLCPFAHREFARATIRYEATESADEHVIYDTICNEILKLDQEPAISTTLLLLPAYQDFASFLSIVGMAEHMLVTHGWQHRYQFAHFHPDYVFSNADPDDPANYTNRSPVAILHFLRSEHMTKVLERYPDPENIPVRNVARLRELGIEGILTILNKGAAS